MRFHAQQPIATGDDEIPLAGGRVTQGVVRVGDTVRRPHGQSSDFVAGLLRHPETLVVVWAPRYLGQDRCERDILTYITGGMPQRWSYFSDEQVADAALLFRAFHDATRGSTFASTASVVCHNDFGPNNAVFRDERPVAMIDFDTAAAGEPLEDLGYTAGAWCISSQAQPPPIEEQARQVRVLLDAYGGLAQSDRMALVTAVSERLERNVRFWTDALHNPGGVATPAGTISEIIVWSRTEAAFVEANRRHFDEALR